MYPTRWMVEETFKNDYERYLERVGKMRINEGESENLIAP